MEDAEQKRLKLEKIIKEMESLKLDRALEILFEVANLSKAE